MSIAKPEQTAAAGEPRARGAWGFLLSAAVLATTSCGQRNLAVISLSDVPSSATAITAYYRLDGGEWKSVVPQRGLQQFGIELPKDRSAKLETQVFGYNNRVPCSLGSASGSADLDGGSIRELSLSMAATTSRCTTVAEPADFPRGKLAVWANTASDIWIAGPGGKIVHWDGSAYAKVPLPQELAAKPPDWNAIWSSGTDVWIVGSNSAVVRYERGALSVVPLLTPIIGPTDWRAIDLASMATGGLVLVGSNRTIGLTGPSVKGVGQFAFNCGGVTPPGDLTSVGCGIIGSEYLCIMVTDGGGIAALQQSPICRNIKSPTTKSLLDVYVGVNLNEQAFDVRIVGKGGYALRGLAQVVTGMDPNFTAAGTDYSTFIPQSARVDLNQIGGSGLDDLWIAGQGGVLMRWPNTPSTMLPTGPFALTTTGSTADLSSLSGFGGNLFFGGSATTLGYLGPLFTPN